MWSRNRIGIALIVAFLLFDLFIIKYHKPGSAHGRSLLCYPIGGSKYDTLSNLKDVNKKKAFINNSPLDK